MRCWRPAIRASMRSIRSGKNRQRVELYDIPETTFDSYRQPQQATTLIGTFWAEVRPLSGREALNVKQVWATATHKVSMRWLGSSIAIQPRMKLVITKPPGTRTLNILEALNNEERDREWQLTCEEHINATS